MQQRKQRPFLKSLRGKLSLQMLLLSLIPVAIVGFHAYFSMSSTQDIADSSVNEARADMQENVVGVHLAGEANAMNMEMSSIGINFA